MSCVPLSPPAGKVRGKLAERSAELFRQHDWWWAVTGVHQGGGLDTTLVIRKRGPEIGIGQPPPGGAQPA